MARRIVCCLALALLVAAPASGGFYDRKQDVDNRIAGLQSKLAQAQEREASLTAEIASVSDRIRSLEADVGDVSSRLAALEDDLALHQRKLDALTALYELQSERLAFLRSQYKLAVARLSARLVAIYEGDDPSTLDVLVEAKNFRDILEQLEFLESIADQDRTIVKHVAGARDHMRELRARTGKTKARVAAVTRVIKVRTEQARALRTRLIAQQQGLASARRSRRASLVDVRQNAQQYASEAAALQAESANLAAQIRSAQAAAAQASVTYSSTGSSDTTPSASGLIWPVSGPVVSPFGMRWGRLHAGVDIAVPSGTPVHAAKSGRVLIAGWVSGYGNYTCIGHGGGLSTCYGHQTSIGVSVGQSVSQGQVIGYSGCTGHCFGPHVHFETRINGVPVNPMGYL
jgi:murein DD-endopeptidase MepM/ murein hydrolase activator NlpD